MSAAVHLASHSSRFSSSRSLKEFSNTPHAFLCPIGFSIMDDPVVALDGFSYERQNILRWFQIGRTSSPSTNALLESTVVVPNLTLRSAIQDWLRQQDDGGINASEMELDETVPTQDELMGLCEEARADDIDELVQEIGRLARIEAMNGKRCFEDDFGNMEYLPLKNLQMFKRWMGMADGLASSIFVDASSPLFAGDPRTGVSSPLPRECLLPLPTSLRSSTYTKMVFNIFRNSGLRCEFCVLNDELHYPVIDDKHSLNHGKRELPVCIWLSWDMPETRARNRVLEKRCAPECQPATSDEMAAVTVA